MKQDTFNITGELGDYEGLLNTESTEQDRRAFKQVEGNEEAEAQLYARVAEYNSHEQRQNRFAQFKEKYPNDETLPRADRHQPDAFRQALIRHLQAHDIPVCQISADNKRATPEAATIELEAMLGPKGAELYRMALAEEAHTRAFRQAVFENASQFVSEQTWAEGECPVLIISGPSASGKSYVQRHAFEEIRRYLPRDPEDETGSYVVSVDGGVVRETSQIRRLMIQVANARGYTGVRDLHSKSRVLENIKQHIQEAALATRKLGLSVPDTFSHMLQPNKSSTAFMKRIQRNPQRRLFFSRVQGKRRGIFKKVVAHLGSRRAWKTQWPADDARDNSNTLDLNNTQLCESKRYGAGGFGPGNLGSRMAERWYRSRGARLNLIITNDLVRVVPSEYNAEGNPIGYQTNFATQEAGILLPERALKAWQAMPETERAQTPLAQYARDHAADHPPLIKTSSEMQAGLLSNRLRRLRNKFSDKAQVLKILDDLSDKLEAMHFDDKAEIDALVKMAKANIRVAQRPELTQHQRSVILRKLREINRLAQSSLRALQRAHYNEQPGLKSLDLGAATPNADNQQPATPKQFVNLTALKTMYAEEEAQITEGEDERGQFIEVTRGSETEHEPAAQFTQRPNQVSCRHANTQTITLMVRALLIENGVHAKLNFMNCSNATRALAQNIAREVRQAMLSELTVHSSANTSVAASSKVAHRQPAANDLLGKAAVSQPAPIHPSASTGSTSDADADAPGDDLSSSP